MPPLGSIYLSEFLIVITSGFVLSTYAHRLRNVGGMSSSYGQVFYYALLGICLYILSGVLLGTIANVIGKYSDTFVEDASNLWTEIVGIISFQSAVSVALAWPISKAFNWKWGVTKSLGIALRHSGRFVELTLYEAATQLLPVYVVTRCGKVYIGYVFEIPDLNQEDRASVVLGPIYSGYRDPRTLRAIITSDYSLIVERVIQFFNSDNPSELLDPKTGSIKLEYEGRTYDIEPENFGVAIYLNEIDAINIWDHDVLRASTVMTNNRSQGISISD